MVKKFVFHMKPTSDCSTSVERLLDINRNIHDLLVDQKDKITAYHKTKRWDNYKKLTNDYELVFTTHQGYPSIANHIPISRSYFKLWEILVDMKDELAIGATDKAAFLADAPGGFIEAWVNYCGMHAGMSSETYGISLRPSHNVIPNWKLSERYCKDNQIKLIYGRNNNGDLYDLQTIHDFVSAVGEHACGLVTADGGFDFSSDFNNQEEMSLMLLTAEIYTALRIQKSGGSFVLKVFDIHKVETMQLLYVLYSLYEDVYITKPLTSRPANSEKYVVACGFHAGPDVEAHFGKKLHDVLSCGSSLDLELPASFVSMVVEFNSYYISNQVMHICKTLAFDNTDATKVDIIRTQLCKAIKWCHKYSIPINTKALSTYKRFY